MTAENFPGRQRRRTYSEITLQRKRMAVLFSGDVGDDEKREIMGEIRNSDFTMFREHFLTFTDLFGIGVRNDNREERFDHIEAELRSKDVAVGRVPNYAVYGGTVRFILKSDSDLLREVFRGCSTSPSETPDPIL